MQAKRTNEGFPYGKVFVWTSIADLRQPPRFQPITPPSNPLLACTAFGKPFIKSTQG